MSFCTGSVSASISLLSPFVAAPIRLHSSLLHFVSIGSMSRQKESHEGLSMTTRKPRPSSPACSRYLSRYKTARDLFAKDSLRDKDDPLISYRHQILSQPAGATTFLPVHRV